jgi:hypothetical protein
MDPRFTGSNLAKDDGFLMMMKIPRMIFFGGEVKPYDSQSTCCVILRHVEDP